ncbi:MAG: 16S rRNA (uracil(1498)-N(3))-methyltransferase [Bacilli bacterium]|nr:16S rRNA (uracil(1498)-N(3))-methyltransferase [Bacilli bacterium]
MQRYFALNKNLKLSDKDIHHITNVMRMKINDNIEVVYDKKVYLCKIESMSKDDVIVKVIEEKQDDNELEIKVTIAVPLVNEKKIDFILQKATELGAFDFIVYDSERSKVKVNEKIDKKISRWNLITKEAAEQSFRNVSPNVYGIMKLKELVNLEYDLSLVASTKNIKKTIKNVMQNSTNCDRIIIVVGPEGGLTNNEEDFLLDNGYVGVTFGSTILRCETAPIFIMSAIKYELMR